MDTKPPLKEFHVETRQVVYRDCRVFAATESEARSLVREGKAGLVEMRPVETHKVTAAWPVAIEARKLSPPCDP